MTNKKKPPLTGIQIFMRVIFWILVIIVSFYHIAIAGFMVLLGLASINRSVSARVIFWVLVVIASGYAIAIAGLMIMFVWAFANGPDESKFWLQNYEELDALIQNDNISTDGKNLPLFEGLTTSDFWVFNYGDNIPPELTEKNIVVAENRDGFQDTTFYGLFTLSTQSAEALSKRLVTNFSKEAEGADINDGTERTICLNHSMWRALAISYEKKNHFLEFCSQLRQADKIRWELFMPTGDIGFDIIYVTEYLGTTFFTVSHGGS